MKYIKLSYVVIDANFGFPRFAIVGVERDYEYITEYVEEAKTKLCMHYGYERERVRFVDSSFMGANVAFI